MPLFFFDLVTPTEVERDLMGLSFVSLDEAYLSASQAALEIAIDMLRKRENPSRYQFAVRNEHGAVVLELPFSEVLQPGRAAKPHDPVHIHKRLKANLDRNRALKSELVAAVAQTRRTLTETLREATRSGPVAKRSF